MPNNNEIRTGAQTTGEFTISYQQDGYGATIPIIDGTPEPRLMFGYVSESDKAACMELLEKAIRATNGDVMQAQFYIMNAVQVAANEIKPDEVVDVDGVEVLISYADKSAYILTEKVADIDDLECELPNEAIKAILVERTDLYIKDMEREREGWEELLLNAMELD